METTKQDVEQQYAVSEDGIIHSPGKFEGEPYWAAIVYGWMLEGDGDEDYNSGMLSFGLSPEDRKRIPELANFDMVYLEENGDGFVHVTAQKIPA